MVDADRWAARVQEAATTGDEAALRVLFQEAIEEWGRESASRQWQEALSGFDAAAITG